MKYQPPIRYAVYEIEARMNAEDNMPILGTYKTAEEAEESRIKYGFISDNYVVRPIPSEVDF